MNTRNRKKKELIVETNNPEALDKTINSLGGVVGQNQDGSYENVGTPFKKLYAVRAISGDIGFLSFSIKNQGYAKIVEERNI